MKPMVLAAALAAGLAAGGRASAAPAPVDYVREIRPILAKNCFACHGSDEGHRAAGLRLDQRTTALARRGSNPGVIVPGQPEASRLLRRVTLPDGPGRMPPPGSGPHLKPEEIDRLRRWIREGAAYREHWAWIRPRQAPLPVVRQKSWPRNEVDRFVLARLEKAGLKPSPEADRFTLLRRVSLDLRGLPPTPEEVDAFARDRSPDAYEKMVDRFLADPAYGERWARMWLDLARYADSAGYGSDPLRLNIWPYRDWVIDAFNRNLPYDTFTIDQLAGDLLPGATTEQKVATAFHRNTMTNTEGGTTREEFRVAAVKDRVDTTMQVWMGLTMGCAKCHSHKYDPITQKEYYQLFAVFNQTADNDQPSETPTLPVLPSSAQERNRELDVRIAELKRKLGSPETAADPKATAALKEQVGALEKQRVQPVPLPVMVEVPPAQHRETHLLIKSNYLDPGEKVEPGVPAAFHPFPKEQPCNRLTVAQWIVDPRNPLTARVAVNRFWAQLFGTGLVETEEDFGTQGDLPSHPELLDWLAVRFQSGAGSAGAAVRPWDMKALLRLIVTSATYRQASRATPALLERDPRNRLLSRGPRYRLEAEMVRDQALALSGLLSRKVGGPSVFPPQPDGLWQAAFNGQRTWTTSSGEDRYRRGLYTFLRRTVPYPSMATFDAPSREFCVVRRSRTNTPLQAFVTLNDPVYVETAQALARRIVKEGGATTEDRARYGLRLCLARPADPARVSTLTELFNRERARYGAAPDAARAMATEPLGPLPAGADVSELAAWTVVANVLLNLDGVLTKG